MLLSRALAVGLQLAPSESQCLRAACRSGQYLLALSTGSRCRNRLNISCVQKPAAIGYTEGIGVKMSKLMRADICSSRTGNPENDAACHFPEALTTAREAKSMTTLSDYSSAVRVQADAAHLATPLDHSRGPASSASCDTLHAAAAQPDMHMLRSLSSSSLKRSSDASDLVPAACASPVCKSTKWAAHSGNAPSHTPCTDAHSQLSHDAAFATSACNSLASAGADASSTVQSSHVPATPKALPSAASLFSLLRKRPKLTHEQVQQLHTLKSQRAMALQLAAQDAWSPRGLRGIVPHCAPSAMQAALRSDSIGAARRHVRPCEVAQRCWSSAASPAAPMQSLPSCAPATDVADTGASDSRCAGEGSGSPRSMPAVLTEVPDAQAGASEASTGSSVQVPCAVDGRNAQGRCVEPATYKAFYGFWPSPAAMHSFEQLVQDSAVAPPIGKRARRKPEPKPQQLVLDQAAEELKQLGHSVLARCRHSAFNAGQASPAGRTQAGNATQPATGPAHQQLHAPAGHCSGHAAATFVHHADIAKPLSHAADLPARCSDTAHPCHSCGDSCMQSSCNVDGTPSPYQAACAIRGPAQDSCKCAPAYHCLRMHIAEGWHAWWHTGTVGDGSRVARQALLATRLQSSNQRALPTGNEPIQQSPRCAVLHTDQNVLLCRSHGTTAELSPANARRCS